MVIVYYYYSVILVIISNRLLEALLAGHKKNVSGIVQVCRQLLVSHSNHWKIRVN